MFHADPKGNTRKSKNPRQDDNTLVSEKQARNWVQTEGGSRKEIPITFASSLCARELLPRTQVKVTLLNAALFTQANPHNHSLFHKLSDTQDENQIV
jgi:hypothetical protein